MHVGVRFPVLCLCPLLGRGCRLLPDYAKLRWSISAVRLVSERPKAARRCSSSGGAKGALPDTPQHEASAASA